VKVDNAECRQDAMALWQKKKVHSGSHTAKAVFQATVHKVGERANGKRRKHTTAIA
jgi:hypothetical protein